MLILIRTLFTHLVRWRIKSIEGLENIPKNNEAVLYISNHVGQQDPILLYSILIRATGKQPHTIAKWKILSNNFSQKYLGTIPLYDDRSKTIDHSVNLLKQDKIVVIFPEGGVNENNNITKIKTGAARIALKTRVKIVPIGLIRANSFPKTEFGHFMDIFFGRLKIKIGSTKTLNQWYNKFIDQQTLNEVNYFIMSEVALLANKKLKLIK